MFWSWTGRTSPRLQGDIGELSAMGWLITQGAKVFLPFGHSPDVDLVADFGDELLRVQVKTSTVYRNARFEVTLATRGATRAGTASRSSCAPADATISSSMPAMAGAGSYRRPRSTVARGFSSAGPKYAAYEVESDVPLKVLAVNRIARLADPRRGSRAVKGVWL